METNQPAAPEAPSLAPIAQVVETDSPPWIDDEIARATAPVRRPMRKAAPAAPIAPEQLHWGIVLLTLVTAASVLFGSHGAAVSHSRELLPVMMTVPAR